MVFIYILSGPQILCFVVYAFLYLIGSVAEARETGIFSGAFL